MYKTLKLPLGDLAQTNELLAGKVIQLEHRVQLYSNELNNWIVLNDFLLIFLSNGVGITFGCAGPSGSCLAQYSERFYRVANRWAVKIYHFNTIEERCSINYIIKIKAHEYNLSI